MLSYYPNYPNGAARIAYDEAIYLASLGHEVWCVTQDPDVQECLLSIENNVRILRYPTPKRSLLDPRKVGIHQSQTQECLTKYLGKKVDIVHGHALLQYAGAMKMYEDGTRLCYSVHSPVRMELQAQARGLSLASKLSMRLAAHINHGIEKRCLDRSDRVMVYSQYARSLLAEQYSNSIMKKSLVLPGWVDLDRFRIIEDRTAVKVKLGWPTDAPVLFTLRRLVPRMGIERLLQAVRILRGLGLRFYLAIAGDGMLRPRLEHLSQTLGIQDIVSFVGRVSDQELPLMYGAADAFVLPTSELECFGLIVIESLACGRPVLATPIGAIPEILTPIEPKWLAQDATVNGITQLLTRQLRDELPFHRPEELREFVETRYDRKAVLSSWADSILN